MDLGARSLTIEEHQAQIAAAWATRRPFPLAPEMRLV